MKQILLLFCLLAALQSSAQQARLDSLLAAAAANTKPDSIKLAQLTQVFRQYARMRNFPQVDAWGARAVAIAKQLPGYLHLFHTYRRLALAYHGAAEYLPAVDHYEKAAALARQHNDLKLLGGIYLNLSALYTSIQDYPKALDASQQAIDLYNELKDVENASSCYMNIGIVYSEMGQQDKAIEYMQKALAIFKTQNGGLHYGGAIAYSSLSRSISMATDQELRRSGIDPKEKDNTALSYLQQALRITEQAPDAAAMQSEVYANIGKWYQQHGDRETAARHYATSLQIARRSGEIPDLANILLTSGAFHLTNGDLEKGRSNLEESLAISRGAGILSNQSEALEQLSVLYDKKGQADSALAYFRKHITIKEAILNAEKEKDITRRQLKLDFSIKENDYRLRQQLVDGQLRQQLLLATQRQQQLLVEQQKVELISRQKDLERLRHLQERQQLQSAKDRQLAESDRRLLQARVDKSESEHKIGTQALQLAEDKKMQAFFGVALLLLCGLAGFVLYDRWKTKKLNRIIQAQKEQLEQLSLVKDKIFGVVSHDMRAPVNSLVSFINLLEEGQLKQEKLSHYAHELKGSLDHTSSLMNNLLVWAASQMKGFQPRTEAVNAREVLADVLLSVQHYLRQKEVRVEDTIPAGLMLHTDRNMLAVVLRNLLSNAIKYSHGGAVVRVSALQTEGSITFEVADEGTGIGDALAQRFNGTYTGVNNSMRGTANEKGTGLGLLLCKTFVEQMNGSIMVHCNGAGTSFLVKLPATTGSLSA